MNLNDRNIQCIRTLVQSREILLTKLIMSSSIGIYMGMGTSIGHDSQPLHIKSKEGLIIMSRIYGSYLYNSTKSTFTCSWHAFQFKPNTTLYPALISPPISRAFLRGMMFDYDVCDGKIDECRIAHSERQDIKQTNKTQMHQSLTWKTLMGKTMGVHRLRNNFTIQDILPWYIRGDTMLWFGHNWMLKAFV